MNSHQASRQSAQIVALHQPIRQRIPRKTPEGYGIVIGVGAGLSLWALVALIWWALT